jgi:hypothetical protein
MGYLNRRKFLTSTAVATVLIASPALAGLHFHGTYLAASKRSNVNINVLNVFEYAFIDHLKQADSMLGPYGVTFTSTAPFHQLVDSSGWPNDASASGQNFGCGFRIPDPAQFAGPYILTWDGSGTVNFNVGTWTETNNTGTTYTKNSNASWTQIAGQKARIIMNLSTAGLSGPQLIGMYVSATGGTDGFVRNMQFYRQADETDLLAGKIFRAGFKQLYVDFNPKHIRFMDWNSVNASQLCRFEHRNLPAYASWMENHGALGQPKYGTTTGTNQIALASVTGMPVSMQQGEMVTCRIGNTIVRTALPITITAVTKQNPGHVTASAHGYNTGDIIIHQMMSAIPGQAPSGMTQLDNVPCTITVIDANTYTIGIDTTAFSTFTVGTAYQYISLNVGARGTYPVVFQDGCSPGGRFGAAFCTANDIKTFTFDKNIIASTAITGAWIMRQEGGNGTVVLNGGVPLEICTAFVNELMAMTTNGPIDMWVCIPHRGMNSTDPDYLSASNWGTNTVDVILNGKNGYAGLDSRSTLFVEHSNETWNTGFYQTLFMAKMSLQTWPALGSGDYSTYSSLRSVQTMADIKAAFPGNSRIKYVLSGQGSNGSTVAPNTVRFQGNSQYAAAIGNGNTPLSNFDYFAWAGYFTNNDSTPANSLTTCASTWPTGSGPGDEALYATYVAGITTTAIGGSETTGNYANVHLPDYAAATLAQGKKTIMYEGGWDHGVQGYTTNQNNFLAACKASQTWANALRAFHEAFNTVANADSPADYIMVNNRWGHTPTDTYLGGVEGAALDLAWQALKARNNGH